MENTQVEVVNQNQQIAITPDQMLMKAIESNMDIDKLEKLLSLKERWDAKNAERAFFDAMNSFQANKPKLTKNKKVAFKDVKYSYNPLPDIQEIIDPILGRFGLSYNWEQSNENGKIKITCVVSHVDGHSKSTWLDAPADTTGSKNQIQAIGSTVTYLKRYTLENALGLSSGEDNDGKDGPKVVKLPVPTQAQWKQIVEKFKTGDVDLNKIKESFQLSEDQEKEITKLT